MQIRQPWVAGRFYPASQGALDRELSRCLSSEPGVQEAAARAIVVPHAGYVYSGAIAGHVYAQVRVPERVIVLCPNHTGEGVRKSIWQGGAFRVPNGDAAIDDELTARLVGLGFSPDTLAHLHEHAIEVQVPFLLARNAQLRMVAICLAQLSLEECDALGTALAHAVDQLNARDSTLIVVSTDFSHYVSAEAARRLDTLALERISARDPRGLYETVRSHDISMCGYVPTTVALIAANALGAERCTLDSYANSGDVSGDFGRVVGYGGAILS